MEKTLETMPKGIAKLSGGNIKLGNMMSFSKLYGDSRTVVHLPNGEIVNGTCNGHCQGCFHDCYVGKSYRYKSVVLGHTNNTIAFHTDLEASFENIRKQLARKKKPVDCVRINQSGELETVEEFRGWCETARQFPQINFYLYTKAYELVTEDLLNGLVPNNLTVLISVWHEYGVKEYEALKHLDNVKAFVYVDSDYLPLTVTTMCRAYSYGGKLNHEITCDKCRKCFNRFDNHKVIGCEAH